MATRLSQNLWEPRHQRERAEFGGHKGHGESYLTVFFLLKAFWHHMSPQSLCVCQKKGILGSNLARLCCQNSREWKQEWVSKSWQQDSAGWIKGLWGRWVVRPGKTGHWQQSWLQSIHRKKIFRKTATKQQSSLQNQAEKLYWTVEAGESIKKTPFQMRRIRIDKRESVSQCVQTECIVCK